MKTKIHLQQIKKVISEAEHVFPGRNIMTSVVNRVEKQMSSGSDSANWNEYNKWRDDYSDWGNHAVWPRRADE